jgi:hypothetical protein
MCAARLQLPGGPHTLPPVTTRLRILSEAEAYARCYGGAGDDVKVVRVPRRPRYQLDVSGEDLRVAFAERLDRREPELAEGMEAGAVGEAASSAPPGFDSPAAPFESPSMPFASPSVPFESPAAFETPDAPLERPAAEPVEPPAAGEPAHGEEAA